MAEERVDRRLAAIPAADAAGYSRLMGADEEGTLASLTGHLSELIIPCITEHGGRLVKTTGDGVLAEFPSVVDAVRCALAWQDGMRRRNAQIPATSQVLFRIGINLGDVIVRDGDVFGDGVNIAARLEALAEPAGICISGAAYEHLHGKLGVDFVPLGEKRVKNIARPIRAYRLVATGTIALAEARRPVLARRAGIALAIAAIVVGAGAFIWSSERLKAPASEPTQTMASVRPSIAVLPFVNSSEDQAQQYFAEGVAEDIIIALSKNSALDVIARNSSFQFRSEAPDAEAIAVALRVRYLLSGSVRRERDRIRLTVELIDTESSTNVWADRFDRQVEDVFAVQDEITERIIVTLVAEVARAEIARTRRKPPATLAAYDNYLRGLELFRARATRPPWGKTLLESREFLELAILQDPGFGLAWSVLAENYVSAWIQQPHYEPLQAEHQNPATLNKALMAARRAIEADPGLAEGYAKMGWVLHWMRRPQEAQGAYAQAFAINPNLLDDAYPNALVKFGRHAEAVTYLLRQVRVDPSFGRNYGNLGLAQYMQRDHDAAIESLKTCKRLAAGWRACNIWMAAALAQSSSTEGARAEVATVVEKDQRFSVSRYVAFEPYARPVDADYLADGLLKAGFAP